MLAPVVLGVGGVAFVVALGLTRWAIALAHRHDLYDMPGVQRIHQTKVPNLGWIGLSGGWVFPLGLLAVLVLLGKVGLGDMEPYRVGMLKKMLIMIGITAGAGVSILLGWWDDRRQHAPLQKVAGQVLLGALLYFLGVRITLFGPEIFHFPLTVLWVVCVMNAFNLLDNLDGACAGVALIGCSLFLCVAASLGQFFICLLLVAFMGALGGFLVFNSPPAKIFMGNAGSSFVGYVMSALTILETFYQKGVPSHLAVIMPVLILAVPIYDTASVVLIRFLNRAPIFCGDTNHFSHRLLRHGWSTREVTWIIYCVTVLMGLGALGLPFVDTRRALLLLAGCLGLMALLGVWEGRSRRNSV